MRHRAEYVAVLALRRLVRILPHAVVRAMGAALGLAFYAVDRVHRRVADTNLATAFPNRSPAERRQITRAMFVHFGRLLVRAAAVQHLTTRRCDAASSSTGKNAHAPRTRRARACCSSPGTSATGRFTRSAMALRFSRWRAGARARQSAPECAARGRALEDRQLGDLPPGCGAQGVARAVAGQGVALLIDQHMHSPDAIYVDFFERSAATTSMLAALALRTGAPVVPVFALPLGNGRYRLIYEHPVAPPRSGFPRRRFASSRSGAPTCSRCTCAGTRRCGCGCTGAGVTRRCPPKRPACSPMHGRTPKSRDEPHRHPCARTGSAMR